MGYYSQRIPLGENNRIDVALSEDIQSLDEVVEMTTINPARALGEDYRRGTLKPGVPADSLI